MLGALAGENPVVESRAALEKLWSSADQDTGSMASMNEARSGGEEQGVAAHVTKRAEPSVIGQPWADNNAARRVHPPAGH